MDERIKKLRQKIDKIDAKIINLLDTRAKIAKKIYEIKRQSNMTSFDPFREHEKIIFVEQNIKVFPKSSAKHIFVEIFSGTRKLYEDIKVGFLGPEGSFSWEAALKVFGQSCIFLPLTNIEDIFEATEKFLCNYGVVPLENSRDGIVGETLDLLVEKKVKIVYEISVPVSFSLLSMSDDISKIKRIYSHQKAIAQCSRWIRENLKNAEVIYTSSTSEGARLASEDPEGSAISPERLSQKYNLKVLFSNIQDSYGERTEFIVIRKEDEYDNEYREYRKEDKPVLKDKGRTILNLNKQHYFESDKIFFGRSSDIREAFCFSVKDEPGALYRVLEPLAQNKINMKKIHSRPDKITKRYNFFVEIERKHGDDKKIQSAFEKISKNIIFFKTLGVYAFRRD
jgi:chorismate mutase/prephenate dehydratase